MTKENEYPSLEEIFEDTENANELEEPKGEESEESLEQLLNRINGVPKETPRGELKYQFESDIGKEDHRAFLYYTIYKRRPTFALVLLLLPIVCALVIMIQSAGTAWYTALVLLIITYIILFAFMIFRVEFKLHRMQKDVPEVLKVTKTKLSFFEGKISNLKNGTHISVSYDRLLKVAVAKKMIILYFDNDKAMIIRNEDIDPSQKQEFIDFIKSKIIRSK
ncbi:MAG: YcxB family protein [Clostridia bacterium]